MIDAGEVAQQTAAAADHGKQTALSAEILGVAAEVSGKFLDFGSKNSDLNLGGTGVAIFACVLGNDASLGCFVHFDISLLVVRIPQQHLFKSSHLHNHKIAEL